jgi:hypothetical protein
VNYNIGEWQSLTQRKTLKCPSPRRTRAKQNRKIRQHHDDVRARPIILEEVWQTRPATDDLEATRDQRLLASGNGAFGKGKTTGQCAPLHLAESLEVCDQGTEVATASTAVIAADPEHRHVDAEALLHDKTTLRMISTFGVDCPTRFLISRFWFSTKAFLGKPSYQLAPSSTD